LLQLGRSRYATVRVARAQVNYEACLCQATDDGFRFSLVGSRCECDFRFDVVDMSTTIEVAGCHVNPTLVV
jgi:hypothetical protein